MLVSWRYTIPILLACLAASDAAQAGDSDPYFPKLSYFKSYLRRADHAWSFSPRFILKITSWTANWSYR